MLKSLNSRSQQVPARSNRSSNHKRRAARSSHLGLESLESREMLSASSPTFHVVNDATANISYDYAANGSPLGSSSLASANAAPRGAASTVAVEQTWVIDANRKVYVYNADRRTCGFMVGRFDGQQCHARGHCHRRHRYLDR